MKTAVFPGSFDPITLGHESIVRRASVLFDRIIIAVGENNLKKSMFSVDNRVKWLKAVFQDLANVDVVRYQGLTVDFCREAGARYIVRGLRTSADFEFERSIGQVNRKLDEEIETVFFLSDPQHTSINSSIVRDIVRYDGDIRGFIPSCLDPAELRAAFTDQS
jgi:pantetheine-phosphate adenylyltransferase